MVNRDQDTRHQAGTGAPDRHEHQAHQAHDAETLPDFIDDKAQRREIMGRRCKRSGKKSRWAR